MEKTVKRHYNKHLGNILKGQKAMWFRLFFKTHFILIRVEFYLSVLYATV